MKRFVKFFCGADGINIARSINEYAEENNLLLISVSGDEGFHRAFAVFERLPMPTTPQKEKVYDGCEGCCHNTPCSYFEDEDRHTKTEEELIIEHCGGCCCGDGLECNKGMCCENYETEEEVEEYGVH